MKYGICTIDDFDFSGRTVLLRVDVNEPLDPATGAPTDTTRIRESIPTIRELSGLGTKLVVLGHQGSDIEYRNYGSTRPHADVISGMLGREIGWIDDVTGPAALDAVRALRPGGILLLQNVRYCAEEQTLFETKLRLTHEQQAKTRLVRKLAPLADGYVCDAFAAAHRDQPSLCGFEQVLPSCMGRLFEKEYCALSRAMETPAHPCLFLLGGAKIADAFAMMDAVLSRGSADRVLTGGLVAHVMLAAKGVSLGEATMGQLERGNLLSLIPQARGLLDAYGDRIALPADLAYVRDGERAENKVGQLSGGDAMTDIGTDTIRMYSGLIAGAKTIFINGPVGVFEKTGSEKGTRDIWTAAVRSQAYTVVGGGDSVAAANRFGVAREMSYLCTGGGALIRFLSGEELPAVAALRQAARRFGCGFGDQEGKEGGCA